MEVLQMEVGEGIEERRRGWRSAYSSVGAPLGRGGGMFTVWNGIEALQIEVREGIEERQMNYRSANPDRGASILASEHHWGGGV